MRALALALLCATACSDADGPGTGTSDEIDGRPPRVAAALAAQAPAPAVQERPGLASRYDFDRPVFRADLPGRLAEISGLAFSADGRLFAHDDERGRVHELNPRTGEAGKRFHLAGDAVRDDFEGIAIVGERFFLVSSRGLLYEFREADDRAGTPYHVSNTGVGDHCEVEGLDYDAEWDALLLACKVSSPDRGTILVHRVPIDPAAPRLEPLRIPRDQLRDHGVGRNFEPSAIAVDPSTATLVLVSGPRESIIEVDRAGNVLSAVSLSRSRHPQAEGLGFGANGTLYISDESNGGDARLSAYARRRDAGAP